MPRERIAHERPTRGFAGGLQTSQKFNKWRALVEASGPNSGPGEPPAAEDFF